MNVNGINTGTKSPSSHSRYETASARRFSKLGSTVSGNHITSENQKAERPSVPNHKPVLICVEPPFIRDLICDVIAREFDLLPMAVIRDERIWKDTVKQSRCCLIII